MRRFLSFVAGALSGALVGSVAALLLTPYSGEELIEEVNQQFDAVLEDVKKTAAEERARLEEQLKALQKGEKPAK
jgi:gas vesicle protein